MNKLPKIFIDGGEPEETRQANEMMMAHFGRPLDGQTTNPTLIARNLAARKAQKISEEDALGEYKRIVQEMSRIIPKGSISIQVFANRETKADEMLEQARERNKWIDNASIKFPCMIEGLKAASIACREMPINITLVFSQSQAAAVYEATRLRQGFGGKARYPIFISPFVGRLDDKRENGMEVVKNIKKMYENGDGHVEVLTASVRNIEHILYAIYLQSEIITIPFKVFKLWAEQNFRIPSENYSYESAVRGANLRQIHYRDDLKLGKNFLEYDLSHTLTDAGIDAFYKDWTGLYGEK